MHFAALKIPLYIIAAVISTFAFSNLPAQEDGKLLADLNTSGAAAIISGPAVTATFGAPATATSSNPSEKRRSEILNTPLNGRLSLALINRIEELPKEKMRVHAGLESDSEPAEIDSSKLAGKLADHWKELLVTLVAHDEKSSLESAKNKVESLLSVSEKLGYAMVIQEGFEVEDTESPSLEARLQATEALLARYVYSVMSPRRNAEWWENWRDSWNRGVTRVPEDLVGQWSVKEDSGINFAQATIADHRCTLIWQERAGGKVRKIDFNVMRVDEEHLFADENDSGLRYQLRHENEYDPVLIFDVPGRKADTVLKVQLRPDW